jgi:hypothetical protein
MLSNPWTFWIVYATYFLIGLIWFINRVRIKGFALNPLGFSMTNFNSLFAVLGKKYRRAWNAFGYVSYIIYGNLMLIVFPLTLIIALAFLFRLSIILQFITPIFAYLRGELSIISLTDPMLYIVLVLSIAIHEFFHGILAGAKNVKVHAVGVFFIPFVIIGAYVNIDYEKFVQNKPVIDEQKEQTPSIDLIDDVVIANQIIYIPRQFKKKFIIEADGSTTEKYEEIKPLYSKIPNRIAMQARKKDSMFVIRDNDRRRDIAHIQSAGLFSNLVLAVFGALLPSYLSQHGLLTPFLHHTLQLIYIINIILIIFNLLPIVLTDGGKVLLNKVQDIFRGDQGARMVKIIVRLQGNILIYFIILYILISLF